VQRHLPLGCASQPQGHGRVAFLPWVPVSLKALKPKETILEPQTLGEHIKRARMLRGLSQPKTAALIGVDTSTILNWEKNRTEPPVTSFPAILLFLGYDPYPESKDIPERLRAKRRAMGWSIKEAAQYLGVDEGTWGDWERGKTIYYGKHREVVGRLLAVPMTEIYHQTAKQRNRNHPKST